VDLAAILRLRAVPAAGLFVAVTRRCPLHCAHCSTSSTSAAAQLPAAVLRRFVGGFTAADHPQVTWFTGGEPLLRPRLVAELAGAVRAVGGGSAVLTGGYFAVHGPPPDPIRLALRAVDHVAVSLDPFHEREVPRTAVFALLRALLDDGRAVSVQLTPPRPDGGYLAAASADLHAALGRDVPVLVTRLQPVGRAATWAPGPEPGEGPAPGPLPCGLAAWPVVTFDGTVTACCNQVVVDGRPVPSHLRLGDVAVDGWPTIRRRTLGSPVLQAIRTVGPDELARRAEPTTPAEGCRTCRRLSRMPGLDPAATSVARPDVAAAVDELVGRLQGRVPDRLARRYGGRAFAEPVTSP